MDFLTNTQSVEDMGKFAQTTELYVSLDNEYDTGRPLWRTIIDSLELGITILGLSLNILTIISLQKHRENLSSTILLLLQHQSLLDSWICMMAIAILFQPYMWQTGNSTFDLLLCQVWHGQGMYWGCVLLSVYNLVLIAVERCMAVCRPFVHSQIKRPRIHNTHAAMYFLSVVLLIPAYLQTRYTPEGCLSEYYFDSDRMETFMSIYGIFWFFLIYAIPCGLFIGFYGRILYEVRRRRRESQCVIRVMDQMNSQLTRTLIIVTVLFAFTLGWDSWYYLLGYLKVVEYKFHSPMQIVGVFLSVMNSCLNPVVYLLTMPMFRTSVRKTLTCLFKESHPREERRLHYINELVGIVNPGFVIGIGDPRCEMCSHNDQQESTICRPESIVHLETVKLDGHACENHCEAQSRCPHRCSQEISHNSIDDTNNSSGASKNNPDTQAARAITNHTDTCNKTRPDFRCNHKEITRSISISSTHHNVISTLSPLVLSPFPYLSNIFSHSLDPNICVVPCTSHWEQGEHQQFCRSPNYHSSQSYYHCLPVRTKIYRKSCSLEEVPVKGVRVVFQQSA